MGRRDAAKAVIGWREWVSLPALKSRVKAKVDTGARTSALHAFEIRRVRRGGRSLVRFKVHPIQRESQTTVEATAPFVEMRRVRTSSGHASLRPVVLLEVELCGQTWPIEVTLTSRDEMGFRMLLGRQAVRGRFTVDPGRSFVGGRPLVKKKTRKKKVGKKARKAAKKASKKVARSASKKARTRARE